MIFFCHNHGNDVLKKIKWISSLSIEKKYIKLHKKNLRNKF